MVFFQPIVLIMMEDLVHICQNIHESHSTPLYPFADRCRKAGVQACGLPCYLILVRFNICHKDEYYY